MDLARQMGEHGLGIGEGRLGIDHPALLADRHEVVREYATIGEMSELTQEGELVGIVKRQQPGEEQAVGQGAQHAHGQQERRARRDPAFAVAREAASRYDHVDVRMMGHGRAPGVEHGGDAYPGTEMPGIGGDGEHRLRGGLEQGVVDPSLVLERDGGDLGGQREHDVEMPDRQQVGLARGEPGPGGGALAPGAMATAEGRQWPQSVQASTWPPGAAVRQCSIADLTLS